MRVEITLLTKLKKDSQAGRRNLRMRTFFVLPLTEESGIIEWVPETTGLRNLVYHELAKVNNSYNFNTIKPRKHGAAKFCVHELEK